MGTVLLVLVAMTAVGTAAGVTITAPWFVGRDLQQPQQQQQAMISIMMNNRGPPITAAFAISEKSYHHPKIPATKTHFSLKIDSTILNWLNSKIDCSVVLRKPYCWLLLNCVLGIFQWLFNLLCYVICWLNPSTAPRNFLKTVPAPLENNNSRKTFAAPISYLF